MNGVTVPPVDKTAWGGAEAEGLVGPVTAVCNTVLPLKNPYPLGERNYRFTGGLLRLLLQTVNGCVGGSWRLVCVSVAKVKRITGLPEMNWSAAFESRRLSTGLGWSKASTTSRGKPYKVVLKKLRGPPATIEPRVTSPPSCFLKRHRQSISLMGRMAANIDVGPVNVTVSRFRLVISNKVSGWYSEPDLRDSTDGADGRVVREKEYFPR